jgi:hypothetical protein
MMISRLLLSAAFVAVSSLALAESGTPKEQDACRPDVRRFCHTIKAQDGDEAFLECLELHRDELSAPCRNVLQEHGK